MEPSVGGEVREWIKNEIKNLDQPVTPGEGREILRTWFRNRLKGYAIMAATRGHAAYPNVSNNKKRIK